MVWKSGSCDWLAELANNLTSEPQPRIPSLSLLQPALPLSRPLSLSSILLESYPLSQWPLAVWLLTLTRLSGPVRP